MKWITRERPKTDRIACPWLIRRFIDKDPKFLFVPAPRVLAVATQTDAVPYAMPEVELTHFGELFSLDAFLQRYQLAGPVLTQSAVIVTRVDWNSRRKPRACLPCRLAFQPCLSLRKEQRS